MRQRVPSQSWMMHAAQEQGASSGLPTRSEIDSAYKWRLEDIYADTPAWDSDAVELQNLVERLGQFEGKLGASAADLLEAMRLNDDIGRIGSKLFAYARMRRDEDNANPTYQALTDKAMVVAVQANAATAFMIPEILSIPDSTIQSYIEENADLALYQFALDEILREKPHVLSAPEEALLAEMGEVMGAPRQIFTMYNNADMRFPSITDETGNEIEVTHGRYSLLLESTNRDVRKQAFEAVYSTYGKHNNTLAAVYGASVKQNVFSARVRHYPSAREMALDSDNVSTAVYENLISAVHDALPSLHKYMDLRKQALGVDELQMYDLYVPIVDAPEMKIPYDEAVQTVLDSVAVLGEEYQRVANEGMSSGWVDVYEMRGKTSGAYSWGTYGVHPYMLLNHHDSLDNMFTLAHELGHSMHTYFSHQAQPFVYSGYTIFVAEVASTCNEALLLDYLLKKTTDKQTRAVLINHYLDTIRGTVYRQTMFAEFEKLAHAHVEAGEALTPDWLNDTYYQLNETYYGEACHVNEEIKLEWSRIPHFYGAFYVYKYATGLSAATALSQRILSDGDSAVNSYLEFLSGGSSKYPLDLLRGAGVDMASPEPVKATLDLFNRLVDELAELLA